jgi:hypothetical protein
MKSSVILPVVIFVLIIQSCGPAAEDREMMHQRAKSFQDSIANLIRTQLAEAEGPAAFQYSLDDGNAKKSNNPSAPSGN